MSNQAEFLSSTAPAPHVEINAFDVAPVAVSIEDAPRVTGLSRTRIFDAVRAKELTARKAGKSTIIEIEELKRWVKSMPTKGREVTAASGPIAA